MQESGVYIVDKALEVAVTQLGVSEVPVGSNKGPQVEAYLKSVGLEGGAAWCMAFVYWCFAQAAKAKSVLAHGTDGVTYANPVVKTGGVLDCWNRTAQTKKIMALEAKARPELVGPGDQFILVFGHGTGHTGIVERVDVALRQYHTIEGNSNTDGSREGYEVVRHVRRMDDAVLKGFIKYS